MKSIRYGSNEKKIKQKYEKKKTYVMHYQLLEHWSKGKWYMLRINLFVYGAFYLFWHDYPTTLASLDFSFTVLSMIFFFMIKPNMLRGKIKAYYRRDYQQMKLTMAIIRYFIQGGIIRCFLLALYYGITFYLIRDNPYRIAEYKEDVMEIMINPMIWLITILVSSIILYLLFYHEKYSTIREFSNSVVDIYNSHPYTEKGAVNQFISQRDRELELINPDGLKYDGDWELSYHDSYDNKKPSKTNHSDYNVEESNNQPTNDEQTTMIRRKARR